MTTREFFHQPLQLESGLSADKMQVFNQHPIFYVYRDKRDGSAMFIDAATNTMFWHTTPIMEAKAVDAGYGYIDTLNTRYHFCPVGLHRIDFHNDDTPSDSRCRDFLAFILEGLKDGYTGFSIQYAGIHLNSDFGYLSIAWDEFGEYEIAILDHQKHLVDNDVFRHLSFSEIFTAIQRLKSEKNHLEAYSKMIDFEEELIHEKYGVWHDLH